MYNNITEVTLHKIEQPTTSPTETATSPTTSPTETATPPFPTFTPKVAFTPPTSTDYSIYKVFGKQRSRIICVIMETKMHRNRKHSLSQVSSKFTCISLKPYFKATCCVINLIQSLGTVYH